jgi:tetratricopeptide (TPR) repeat protein
MQYLKNLKDPEINALLEKAAHLAESLKLLEKNGDIDRQVFYETTREICRAFMKQKAYENPFSADVKKAIDELEGLIYETLSEENNSLVLIPITLEVMQANEGDYSELTDYLAETIAINIAERKGLALEEEEPEGYEGPTLEEINEQLDQSAEFADREDFENAVAALNRALDMIGEFREKATSILIIDVPGILNNKAYYLFRLNRLQEALESINLALKENEQYAIAYYTKAEILDEMGQFHEAVACMDEAIDLDDSPDKHRFRKSILNKI